MILCACVLYMRMRDDFVGALQIEYERSEGNVCQWA